MVWEHVFFDIFERRVGPIWSNGPYVKSTRNLYSFQHPTILSVITPCYQGVLYHRKQKFTYFHGGQWKIVYITADFGHKNSDRNLHISLEGRKTNIFNKIRKKKSKHGSSYDRLIQKFI